MSGRSTQRLGVLLLVLVVALLAVGCGGGEEEPSATTTVGATIPAGGASSGGGEAELTQIGPPDGERLTSNYVPTTEDTPAEFMNALGKARPVVVLFYVTGGTDDAAVIESLERLEPSFSRYDFLKYDYSLPDKYGDLTTLLNVSYPPELVLIDRSGIVRQVWTGYVDEGSLNQSLVNLGRE